MLNRPPMTGLSYRVSAGYRVVSALCLTAVALAACSTTQSVKPDRDAVRNTKTFSGEPPVNWSQPLRNAHRVTLAVAGKALGFVIPMPAAGSLIRAGGVPPNQIRLTAGPVWVSGPEVALTFNRGGVTILVGHATYTNPGRTFRTELAAIKVGRAVIRSVNDEPALIIQPRTDYAKSNPAFVEFDLHGLDIQVISTRLGTSLLRAIAETIKG